MSLLTSLRHRPFALLWSGQAVSRLGDRLYQIALIWWVLEKTGSPEAMGTVLIFSFAPMVLFLLLGGLAVDRFPRLPLMFGSDLLRGAVVSVVAGLAFGRRLDLWHVYLASFVFGLVDAVFQPAYGAAIPEITPPALLPSANALTSLSGQITSIAGPGLGAAIVALGGTPTAFALNALSFFVSAACLGPLLAPARSGASTAFRAAHAPPRPGTPFRDLREGIGAVLGTPWLWITVVIAALSNMMQGGAHLVATPFLIRDTLHVGVGALGLLEAAFAVGSILGAIGLGRFAKIRRRGLWAYGGLVVDGMMTLSFGLPIGLIGVAFAAFLMGLSSTVTELAWTNARQELIPARLLGRVTSVDQLGYFGLVPVGLGLAGWATGRLGAPAVFILGGALAVALAVLGLAHPAIRNLD